MYLEFFGLRMFPFANTADPRFFFANEAHEEALANMTYAIEQGKGMVLVTGEVGTGKTLVANVLGLRIRRNALLVTICDPLLRGDQLMRCLHQTLLGPQAKRLDRLGMQTALQARLIAMQRMGQRVAVLVDEAQDLSRGALEQLRLMSNWEHNAQKLIQWVLIGQPELRDRLQRSEWEHLRQRVVLSFHLSRLPVEQVEPYVRHRLRVAAGGIDPPVEFAPGVLERIHHAAGGAPRLINNVCDSAMLAAFAAGARTIGEALLEAALTEMTPCGWTNDRKFPPQIAEDNYRLPAALAG